MSNYPIAVPIEIGGERGTTCDVGTTAVSFRAHCAYAVGTVIDFTIHVPDRAMRFRMECRGRVVRCESDGTEFVTAATIDRIRIGATVIRSTPDVYSR